MNSANLRMTGKGQRGGGHFKFGFGQCVRRCSRFEIGSRVVIRIESNRVGLRQIGNRSPGTIVGGTIAHPERRVTMSAIVALDASAVGLMGDQALKLFAVD